jgi:hypothetical protein
MYRGHPVRILGADWKSALQKQIGPLFPGDLSLEVLTVNRSE